MRKTGVICFVIVVLNIIALCNLDAKVPDGKCVTKGSRLMLSGVLSLKQVPCVEDFVARGGRELEINSPGGDVGSVIRMSEIVHPAGATLFISGECNSSCANYMIPVARRIVMGPKALVLTHGSPAGFSLDEAEKIVSELVKEHTIKVDPSKEEQARLVESGLAQIKNVVSLHLSFVEKHGVPPGYFSEDANAVWRAGELQLCFPNIQIEQPNFDADGFEKAIRYLKARGYIYGRADERCGLSLNANPPN